MKLLEKILIPLDVNSISISKMEKHLNEARSFEEKGLLAEALNELEICLNINNLHLPVIKWVINLHEKLGDKDKAEYYKIRFDEIKKRLWIDNLSTIF